jgi:hypothetical protein
MRGGGVRAAFSGLMGVILSGCFGPSHPDYSRYEYLYIEGAFQPPFTAFPSGNERAGWKCYDSRAGKEFDCTFVRGGWDQYQYIYRPRR